MRIFGYFTTLHGEEIVFIDLIRKGELRVPDIF